MNSIKAWTLTLTFSAMASLLLEILVPNGKLEKIMRLVLSVFMLCAILFPLKNVITSIHTVNFEKNNIDFKSSEDLKNKVTQQTKTYAEENLKNIINQVLNKDGIFPQKINLFMDTTSDNCILFTKVEIYLDDSNKEKKGEIQKIVEKNLNIETVVVLGSD